MSRSRKKHPAGGISRAVSDKPYKRAEHRRERSTVRATLRSGGADLPAPKLFGSPYNSPKDGKMYWNNPKAAWMRK